MGTKKKIRGFLDSIEDSPWNKEPMQESVRSRFERKVEKSPQELL